MLAVLESRLQPYVTCEFDVEKPLDGLPKPELRKTGHALDAKTNLASKHTMEQEDFVPAGAVCLPEIRPLGDSQALTEARVCVAAALEDLRRAERALDDRLANLRQYMVRFSAAA